MDHRPKMKFKVIDGEIYSPADDLLSPEAIEEMLDHYFIVQQELSKATTLIQKLYDHVKESREKAPAYYSPDYLEIELQDYLEGIDKC